MGTMSCVGYRTGQSRPCCAQVKIISTSVGRSRSAHGQVTVSSRSAHGQLTVRSRSVIRLEYLKRTLFTALVSGLSCN
jgi:hypothetical protein